MHEARLLDIRTETADTKTYTLAFTDKAYQSQFTFLPGQCVILSLLGVGHAPFSISSNPLDKKLFSTTIRKVGALTGIMDQLKPGDTIHVSAPFGQGWPMDKMKGKNVLLIGGGIGLLPLWPVIHTIKAQRNDYGHLETLYGARSPQDCMFPNEYDGLAKIKNACAAFSVDRVPPNTQWNYNVGLVTTLFSGLKSQPDNTIVLICGPGIMMHFVIQDILKKGFRPEQIYVSLERRMRCGFGQCGHCQIGPKFVCKDGPVFCYAEIKDLPDLHL